MRWFKTKDLRSSIYAMFSVSTSTPRASDPASMDQVREAMLAVKSDTSGTRKTTAPFFWAAFQLHGDAGPLDGVPLRSAN